MQVTGELVLMFKEDGVPTGFLYENGTREFYECHRASKAKVAELLEADKVSEETTHV